MYSGISVTTFAFFPERMTEPSWTTKSTAATICAWIDSTGRSESAFCCTSTSNRRTTPSGVFA